MAGCVFLMLLPPSMGPSRRGDAFYPGTTLQACGKALFEGRPKIKVNSRELGRRESYLYAYAGRALKSGAFAEQRTYQPQGWPALIFENSIVGSSGPLYPHETWKREAAPRTPEPIEGALRATLNRPKTIAKPT